MGSRPKRKTTARKRPRGRRSSGKPRGRLRSFWVLWLGIMMAVGSVWLVYVWWSGESGPGIGTQPHKTTQRIPSQQMEITLFFSDEQAEYLIAEKRRIPEKSRPSELARAILEELVKGPWTRALPTVPPGTGVRRVVVQETGVCIVDFSRAIIENHPGGTSSELMSVYSIVESLVRNVPAVRSVQIFVEGEARETFMGHLSTKRPLKSDPRYVHAY